MDKETNLENFKGARVVLKLKGENDDFLGRIETASEEGVVFKAKNTHAVLLERDEIESIEFLGYAAEIRQSRLKWPKASTVRKHLATYHNFGLTLVNAMSNERAMEVHESLHKKKDAHDLGHYHSDKEFDNE